MERVMRIEPTSEVWESTKPFVGGLAAFMRPRCRRGSSEKARSRWQFRYIAAPRNHFVIDKAGIQDSGLFSCDRWRAIHCVVIDRNIMNASNRSVRRGSKEGHPPPMNSPARYTMPFSMNKYAHNQCMRRANANMPG